MVSPQDSVASGTSCCVVVHIFHHHAGEQSSQSLKNKQGILVRTCGWRLNPTKKTHQRKLGKVAGLKNFIHSTGERGERWGNSPRNSSGQPSRELRFTWKWAWERGKMHLYHPVPCLFPDNNQRHVSCCFNRNSMQFLGKVRQRQVNSLSTRSSFLIFILKHLWVPLLVSTPFFW